MDQDIEDMYPSLDPRPRRLRARTDKLDYMTVKTYVVMRRVHHSNRERPNVEILDVKLNQAAAQALVDENAGTWFERVVADKRPILTKRG